MEVPCQVASAAMELGVDTTQGRSRRLAKSKDCLKKAARRFGRIRRLRRSAKLSRISKELWTTGALPQASYGHQCNGFPPSVVVKLRRQASQAIAGRGTGRCLTSILSLRMGRKEPALELRRQLVFEWLMVWRSTPSLHFRVIRAWSFLRPRLLDPKTRWARVRGPVSSVIAVLYDDGWSSRLANAWIRNSAQGGRVAAVADGFRPSLRGSR